jgi:hypothetical protein
MQLGCGLQPADVSKHEKELRGQTPHLLLLLLLAKLAAKAKTEKPKPRKLKKSNN